MELPPLNYTYNEVVGDVFQLNIISHDHHNVTGLYLNQTDMAKYRKLTAQEDMDDHPFKWSRSSNVTEKGFNITMSFKYTAEITPTIKRPHKIELRMKSDQWLLSA